MKPETLYRIPTRFLLCAVLCMVTGAPSAVGTQDTTPPATAPLANATVADLKGNVQVELPGQSASAPTLGQVLPAETVITTKDGRILLRLEDGSQILVYSNTRLTLKQPSATSWQYLQMMLGKIKAQIQKRVGGSQPFQIGTPSAVITVRGTTFYVEVDKRNMTRVSVDEGVVEVQATKGTGKSVKLKAGEATRVRDNSDPDPPQSSPGQNKSSDRGNGPGLNPHGGSMGHGKKP